MSHKTANPVCNAVAALAPGLTVLYRELDDRHYDGALAAAGWQCCLAPMPKNLYGDANHTYRRIRIASRIESDMRLLRSTLLHEMAHAALFERGDRSHQRGNEAHGQAFGVEINRLIAAGEDLADELSRVTCGDVAPARLEAAVDEYLARQNRLRKPFGHYDSAGRWLPATGEWQVCCQEIRAPSRAFPLGLLNHCRTIAHVSRLLGVDTIALREAVVASQRNYSQSPAENTKTTRSPA